MSYNGVGLATARGSGTNGYVQRNLSHVKARPAVRKDAVNYLTAPEHQLSRPANQEILEHERKRRIEIKCLELQDDLEENGVGEDEIEIKVQELREKLLVDLDKFTEDNRRMQIWKTHQMAEAKERDNKRFGDALGIRPDFVSGEAFNQELQEQRKQKDFAMKAERKLEIAKRSVSPERQTRREKSKSVSPVKITYRERSPSEDRSLSHSPAREHELHSPESETRFPAYSPRKRSRRNDSHSPVKKSRRNISKSPERTPPRRRGSRSPPLRHRSKAHNSYSPSD